MKKIILFSIILFSLSVINALTVSAQEEGSKYDFSHMQEFRGNNFTLHYPTNYDKEASFLIGQIDKIVPFVEAYGGLEFYNINITIVKSRAELGGAYGLATPDQEKFVIAADFYDAPVLYHEFCHLSEKPFYYPSWFAEGHVFGDCQLKLEEFLGLSYFIDNHNKIRLEDGARLASIKVNLSQWTTPYAYPQEQAKATGISLEDLELKLQFDAEDLIGELSEAVNFTEFFNKVRKDFKGHPLILPNDAIVCTMNEVAKKDVIPIFKKYGFNTGKCRAKVYPPLEKQKQEEKAVQTPERQGQKQQEEQKQEEQGLKGKIINALAVVILAGIIILPILLIYLLIRFIRKRKKMNI